MVLHTGAVSSLHIPVPFPRRDSNEGNAGSTALGGFVSRGNFTENRGAGSTEKSVYAGNGRNVALADCGSLRIWTLVRHVQLGSSLSLILC